MRIKMCLLAAALATFFLLTVTGVATLANENEARENGNTSAETIIPEEIPADEDAPLDIAHGASEMPDTSLIPPGTGTVVDYYIDDSGRVFYTIMSVDKHVFYLIIDRDRNTENVYFLNAVTINDLAPLAEIPLPLPSVTVTVIVTPTPSDTTSSTSSQGSEQSNSSSTGVVVLAVVLAVLGGAAGWYFKVYRPKQKRSAYNSEYVTPAIENTDEHSDRWESNSAEEEDDSSSWDDDERGDD